MHDMQLRLATKSVALTHYTYIHDYNIFVSYIYIHTHTNTYTRQALALGYKIGTCNAPIPAETLAVCGFGSGKNPPCWVERFTTAKVSHLDGQIITYRREDGLASTATKKGFRYWVRADLEQLISANAVTLDHTVNQYASGMDIRMAFSRPEEEIQIPTHPVEGQSRLDNSLTSSVHFTIPSFVEYKQPLGDILNSDVVYRPAGRWTLNSRDVDVFDSYLVRLKSFYLSQELNRLQGSDANSTNKSISAGTNEVAYWSTAGSAHDVGSLTNANADTRPSNGFGIVPGPIPGDNEGAIQFSGNTISSMRIGAYSPVYNSPTFSVEFWLRAEVRMARNTTRTDTGESPPGTGDYLEPSSDASSVGDDSMGDGALPGSRAFVAPPRAILRSVGSDSASGYAFVLSSDGHLEFWMAVNTTSSDDLTSSQTSEAPIGNMTASRFSVVKGCSLTHSQIWRHVVGLFDGKTQKLYCDGLLVASAPVSDAHVPNRDGHVLLGNGCDELSCRQCKNQRSPCYGTPACVALVKRLESNRNTTAMCVAQPQNSTSTHPDAESERAISRVYVPAIDEVAVYSSAISEGLIRGHVRAANATIHAELSFSFGSMMSKCQDMDACTVYLSDSLTPSVFSASPQHIWNDATIVVRGQRFGTDMSKVQVRIGQDGACTPTHVTDTRITCTVRGMAGAFGTRSLSVFIEQRGHSQNRVPVRVTSRVDAISPSKGSLLGGTTLTITGHGFPRVRTNTPHTEEEDCAKLAAATRDSLPLISVMISSAVCNVKMANASTIICVLSRRQPMRISNSDSEMEQVITTSAASFTAGDMDTLARVSVTVGGEPSICSSTEACSFAFSAAVTPVISSISTLCNLTVTQGTDCAQLDPFLVSPNAREIRLHPGTILVIRGSRFSEPGEGVPDDDTAPPSVVTIGSTLCQVQRATAAMILCAVKVGQGGRQPLSVRALAGYAVLRKSDKDSLDISYLDATVLYAVRVTHLYPTIGSQYGGQILTIHGSGFSQKQDENTVLFGGLRASVLSVRNNSVVVVRVPKMCERGESDVGAEQLLYVACSEESSVPSSSTACNDARADTCARILGVSASISLQKRIWIMPSSHVSSLDEYLVDADRDTVWRSVSTTDTQIIVLDLGRTTNVSTVRIEWFGMSVAKNVSVSLAVECRSGLSNASSWSINSTNTAPWEVVTNVNNIRNTSWDHTTVAQFPSETPARFVRITLRGRGDGNADFRIRGVVIARPVWASPGLMDSDSDIRKNSSLAAAGARSVSVIVNQLISVCGTESSDNCNSSAATGGSGRRGAAGRRLLASVNNNITEYTQNCVFEYIQTSSMHTITPASALSGQTVTVLGSAFEASSCTNHRVSIGSSPCITVGCNTTAVWCTVPEQTAGRYTIRMTMDGTGDVRIAPRPGSSSSSSTATPMEIVFDQQLLVSDVSPSETVSLGGEVRLTITGRGFGADVSNLKVNVCGAPCESLTLLPQNQNMPVDSATMTCTMKSAIDYPKRVYTGSLDTVVSSSSDDAYEMLVNAASATNGMVSTVTGTPTMAFDVVFDQEFSLHTMYFRFSSVDLARMGWITAGNTRMFGGNVTNARLYVRASKAGCIRGSILRIQVRDTNV
jgi:hypothetical protein